MALCFEDLQILLYETLMLKPFPNDHILRNYVVNHTYLHYSGHGEFSRPSGYVRALQTLVMFKFGGASVAKLLASRFVREAVESPTFATHAFPVIATDPKLRPIAFEVIEHIEDPRVLRLKALVEHLERGEERALGLLIGLLDPRRTRFPGRYVVNPRALPLLNIARTAPTSRKMRQLNAAVSNADKKLKSSDSSDLVDWITISHF